MITVTITAAAFITGVVAGVIVLLCMAIGREETQKSLNAGPSTRSVAATRRLTGLYVRSPQSLISASDVATHTGPDHPAASDPPER